MKLPVEAKLAEAMSAPLLRFLTQGNPEGLELERVLQVHEALAIVCSATIASTIDPDRHLQAVSALFSSIKERLKLDPVESKIEVVQ